jgi:hypothetical protein
MALIRRPTRAGRIAVKRPGFSIVELMVLVLASAVDCLAIRGILDSRDVFSVEVVFLGLPMATVLLVAPVLVLGRHGGQSRAGLFLVGFEVVGWTSVTALVAASWLTAPVHGYLAETISQNPYAHATHGVLVIVLFTTPQLLLAVIGGFLTRRYLGSIERRRT